MSNKKIAIIGAGIAGLAAGCYLQMNGYHTEIFEMHKLPGGCVTSWKRGGYTIDGSIHGLVGSSPSHPLYSQWDELIDMDTLGIFDSKNVVIVTKNKEEFVKHYHMDRLSQAMKDISPEDSSLVDEYIDDTRRLQRINAFEMIAAKPMEFYNLIDYLKLVKLLPALKIMKKWQNRSAVDFAGRFKNNRLRKIVESYLSPVLFDMLVLTTMDLKQSGYPVNGSLHFSRLIEKRYLELGGAIHYSSKVAKILTRSNSRGRKDVTSGIELESGEKHSADTVISAMDGYSTLFKLLDGKYLSASLSKIYKKADLNPSMVLVSLGVARQYRDKSQTYFINLDSPLHIPDGNSYNLLKIRVFNFDTPLVPRGKTLFIVELLTKNFAYWQDLRMQNKSDYGRAKADIAERMISVLNDYFEDLRENVDMIDVATPATFYRYTNNWNGSTQGWANENIFANKPIKKIVPGLLNFFMIGHWIMPGGGVPNAFMSGRTVAQLICRQDKKDFNTKNSRDGQT